MVFMNALYGCRRWTLAALAALAAGLVIHADVEATAADAQPPSELAHAIDELLTRTWQQERLAPSKPCMDHEYMRRVFLDLVGVIPSDDMVRRFLTSKQATKREELVDELLESSVYPRYTAVVWGNTLVGRSGEGVELNNKRLFREWLSQQFEGDSGMASIADRLLTASGTMLDNPAVYWSLHHDTKPENLTSAATRIFLGIHLQCAQCHDHPFSHWKQTDFYGMAAYFAHTQQRRSLLALQVADTGVGEIRVGGEKDGPIAVPKFLSDRPTDSREASRRGQLADAIVTSPRFAQVVVNREWSRLLGRGLVQPVDDLDAAADSPHAAALLLLAKNFAAAGHRHRYLMQVITRTRAYQLSSVPSRNNAKDEEFFSKALLRRLGPEQIVASVAMSTGLADQQATWDSPLFRLLMEGVQKDFIFAWGNMDETKEATEFHGTIAQSLMMMNSKPMAAATDLHLLSPLTKKLLKCRNTEERIHLLFCATLSRPATPNEIRKFAAYFVGQNSIKAQEQVCEDLYWALLNSNAFAFIH